MIIMKIGLTSYSMNNYICGGLMSVTEVMRFAKEKGAEHIELVPFGFTLHDDKTGEFNEPPSRKYSTHQRSLTFPSQTTRFSATFSKRTRTKDAPRLKDSRDTSTLPQSSD